MISERWCDDNLFVAEIRRIRLVCVGSGSSPDWPYPFWPVLPAISPQMYCFAG